VRVAAMVASVRLARLAYTSNACTKTIGFLILKAGVV